MRLPLSLIYSLLSISCTSVATESPEFISVDELVENAGQYDKSSVVVVGYVGYGFESCTINSVSESGEPKRVERTLWYYSRECMLETKQFRAGKAVISGIFYKDNKGHLGSYFGSIDAKKLEWQ